VHRPKFTPEIAQMKFLWFSNSKIISKFYLEKGKGLDKSSMQMQSFGKSSMQFWK
jgi:hypothetical protein